MYPRQSGSLRGLLYFFEAAEFGFDAEEVDGCDLD